MIYGIGTDLVEPSRIARLLDKYGERFARRILTPDELPAYQKSVKPVLFLANRFAAKEAFSKALGTGLRYPVHLHAISVVQDRLGRPGLAFRPELAEFVRSRGIVNHHLTISDEQSLACAVVILER